MQINILLKSPNVSFITVLLVMLFAAVRRHQSMLLAAILLLDRLVSLPEIVRLPKIQKTTKCQLILTKKKNCLSLSSP